MVGNLAVLISIGVHPISGRARRADLDARAVEIALRLVEQHADLAIRIIHAGNPHDPALRDYLGMGIECVTVLDLSDRCDALEPIADYLSQLKPEIVLAGSHSETGEGSGFLPYALAETLGVAIAPAIIDVTLDHNELHLVQALRAGRRRLLSAPAPLLIVVDKAAPEPRQSAFAKARRGLIETLPVTAREDSWMKAWRFSPARRPGSRVGIPSGTSLAERLASVTEVRHGAGARLVNPTPDEAALAIYTFLKDTGCLDPAPSYFEPSRCNLPDR